METVSGVSFREEQRFTQRWLWALVIAASLMMVGVFGYAIYQQLVLGEPWGDNPMSDTQLFILGPIFMLFGIALLLLFKLTRLITEVRYDGLYVRYIPFHIRFRRYRFDEIESFEAIEYRPLRDYGGWGIKRGLKGWAYNVSGNRGVMLTFRSGKRLMIGSQRAEELEAAIRVAKR
jgi:hypothetical protein